MEKFIFDKNNNTLNCILSGRQGTDSNESFNTRLRSQIGEVLESMNNPSELIICFDMENVTFVASAFIRTCITTSRMITDGNFRLMHASPMIKKTFKIAGLDEILNVH